MRTRSRTNEVEKERIHTKKEEKSKSYYLGQWADAMFYFDFPITGVD